MRWILPAASLLGLLIVWRAHSASAAAFGVVLFLGCGIAAALAFVDSRIRDTSRSEYLSQGEIDALKGTLKPRAPTSERLPPPAA